MGKRTMICIGDSVACLARVYERSGNTYNSVPAGTIGTVFEKWQPESWYYDRENPRRKRWANSGPEVAIVDFGGVTVNVAVTALVRAPAARASKRPRSSDRTGRRPSEKQLAGRR